MSGGATWYRNYSAHFRDESSRIMAMEELISKLESMENLNRHQSIKRIFEAGLETLKDDISFASPKLTESVEMAKLYQVAKAEAAKRKEFHAIYAELGPERIAEVTEEIGVDLEKFLREYRFPVPIPSPSQRMRSWITDCLADGEIHPTDEIIDAATHDGILADPQIDGGQFKKDLSLFRYAASELGVSGGRRNEWQMES